MNCEYSGKYFQLLQYYKKNLKQKICFCGGVGGNLYQTKNKTMARNRKQIEAKIDKNFDLIRKLQKKNLELKIEGLLLSDKVQQYVEEEREVVVSKRPKRTEKVLFGMITWLENFTDEDTGNVVSIRRHQVVRKNGKWIFC